MKTRTAYFVNIHRASDRSCFKLVFGFPPTVDQLADAVRKTGERLHLSAELVNRTLEDIVAGDLAIQPVLMYDAA
jgi:hypothetical protein